MLLNVDHSTLAIARNEVKAAIRYAEGEMDYFKHAKRYDAYQWWAVKLHKLSRASANLRGMIAESNRQYSIMESGFLAIDFERTL